MMIQKNYKKTHSKSLLVIVCSFQVKKSKIADELKHHDFLFQ